MMANYDEKVAEIKAVDGAFVVEWNAPARPDPNRTHMWPSAPEPKTSGTRVFQSERALFKWLKEFFV